jgi:hypothetical protein
VFAPRLRLRTMMIVVAMAALASGGSVLLQQRKANYWYLNEKRVPY